jgi:hypothetical protein
MLEASNMPLVTAAAIVVLIAKPLREILSWFRMMRKDPAQKPGTQIRGVRLSLAPTCHQIHIPFLPACRKSRQNFDMDSIVFIRKIASVSGKQCLPRPGSARLTRA